MPTPRSCINACDVVADGVDFNSIMYCFSSNASWSCSGSGFNRKVLRFIGEWVGGCVWLRFSIVMKFDEQVHRRT